MREPAANRSDGIPAAAPINNVAPNYGAQGVFNAPVYLALESVVGQSGALHMLAALRGVGLGLVVLGVFLFLAGFFTFGYFVVSFITTIFGAIVSSNPRPPDLSELPIELISRGILLAFIGIVVAISGAMLLVWRVTRAAAAIVGDRKQVLTPRWSLPDAPLGKQRPHGQLQPRQANRSTLRSGMLALLFAAIVLMLGTAAFGLLRVDWPNPWGETSTDQIFIVGNTGGEGVYLRRRPEHVDCRPPSRSDNCVQAYPDRTRLQQIGPSERHGGQLWHHVRALTPGGKEGWVLAEYALLAQ